MSKARSALLWIVFALLCGISLWYVSRGFYPGVEHFGNWSRAGLRRLAWFTAAYIPVAFLLQRFRTLWWAGAAAFLIYNGIAAGPLALVSTLLFFAACYCLGERITRSNFWISTLTGAAVYILLISLTAALPVHYTSLYLVLMTAPLVWNWRALTRLRWPATAVDGIGGAVLLWVLLLQWMVVLKPEVSADGLAMHLAIPAEVAWRHFWPFDFQHKLWALMPMGADWLYTLVYLPGGEMAARLLNFGMLAILAGMLFELSGSALATALFASIPVVQLVTGSLFVENTWAALMVGSFAALVRYRESRELRLAVAAATLAGSAISVKFGGLAFVIPLGILLAWQARGEKARLKLALPALLLLFAGTPYANAWMRSGNPLFPFLNRVFRSPFFDQNMNQIEQRYHDPLTWDVLFQVVFRTHRFLEGYDGSAGLCLALLAPVSLLAFGRRTPWRIWTATSIAILFAAASFSAVSYVRYLYPAMAMVAIPVGGLLAGSRAWQTAALALVLLNVCLLPSSGHWHRDFFLPAKAAAWDAYVMAVAPGRKSIEYLNEHHPGETVAFLKHNQIAGLRAEMHQNSWHDWEFYEQVSAAGSAGDVARIAHAHAVKFFVLPAAGARDQIELEPVRQFADRYTEREYTAGALSVAGWKPGAAPPALLHGSPRRHRSPRDVASQLRHAPLGFPPLQDPQKPVGRAPDLRRGLAQQPPRPPGQLPPPPRLGSQRTASRLAAARSQHPHFSYPPHSVHFFPPPAP